MRLPSLADCRFLDSVRAQLDVLKGLQLQLVGLGPSGPGESYNQTLGECLDTIEGEVNDYEKSFPIQVPVRGKGTS